SPMMRVAPACPSAIVEVSVREALVEPLRTVQPAMSGQRCMYTIRDVTLELPPTIGRSIGTYVGRGLSELGAGAFDSAAATPLASTNASAISGACDGTGAPSPRSPGTS